MVAKQSCVLLLTETLTYLFKKRPAHVPGEHNPCPKKCSESGWQYGAQRGWYPQSTSLGCVTLAKWLLFLSLGFFIHNTGKRSLVRAQRQCVSHLLNTWNLVNRAETAVVLMSEEMHCRAQENSQTGERTWGVFQGSSLLSFTMRRSR